MTLLMCQLGHASVLKAIGFILHHHWMNRATWLGRGATQRSQKHLAGDTHMNKLKAHLQMSNLFEQYRGRGHSAAVVTSRRRDGGQLLVVGARSHTQLLVPWMFAVGCKSTQ